MFPVEDEPSDREIDRDLSGATNESDTAAELNVAARVLAGSFTTVAAVLAGVGAVNGGLQRMFLNHRWTSLIGFVLVVMAIGLGVIAQTAFEGPPPQRRISSTVRGHLGKGVIRQRRLIIASGIAFLLGLVSITIGAVTTPSLAERPIVTAKVLSEGGLSHLEGTVRVSGVKAGHVVEITVEGLKKNPPAATIAYLNVARLFAAVLGPDAAGVVESPLHLNLPPAGYDAIGVSATVGIQDTNKNRCNFEESREGCVVLTLQKTSIRPRLVASWDGADSRVLTVQVDAAGVDDSQNVSVRVTGVGVLSTVLHDTALPSDGRGLVTGTFKLAVAASFAQVCVEATPSAADKPAAFASDPLECPTVYGPVTRARLAVPGARLG